MTMVEYNREYRKSRRKEGARYFASRKGYHKIEPCEICGEKDIDVIDSHHIIPGKHVLGEEFKKEDSDTMFLCQNCHKKIHIKYGGFGSAKYRGPTDREEIIIAIRRARERGKKGLLPISDLGEEYESTPKTKRREFVRNLYTVKKMTINDICEELNLEGAEVRKLLGFRLRLVG